MRLSVCKATDVPRNTEQAVPYTNPEKSNTSPVRGLWLVFSATSRW